MCNPDWETYFLLVLFAPAFIKHWVKDRSLFSQTWQIDDLLKGSKQGRRSTIGHADHATLVGW